MPRGGGIIANGRLSGDFSNFGVNETLKLVDRDLPGGPVVKNPPSNAGDAGSIPGRGTKIPHATGQLSLRASTREPSRCNERSRMPQRTSCVPQLRPNAAKKKPPKNKNKNKNKNRTKTCGQTTMYKMDKQQAYIV